MVHMFHRSTFCSLLGALTLAATTSACGGQSQTPPPESPEPSTAPGEAPSSTEAADAGTEGTHKMPDGTEMPGHHHEEGEKTEKK